MTTSTPHGAMPELPVVGALWKFVGRDPMAPQIKPCARALHEMDPDKPPYPESWQPVDKLVRLSDARAAIQQAAVAVPEVPDDVMVKCIWEEIKPGLGRFVPIEKVGPNARMVPIKPTREMLNAAIDVDSFKLGDISPLGFRMSPQQLFEKCYAAMLAAAPEVNRDRVHSDSGGSSGVTQPLTAESFEAMLLDTSVTPAMAAKRVGGALDTDAQRYRHLRECRGMEHDPLFAVRDGEGNVIWGGDLDDEIDKSIAYSRDIYGEMPITSVGDKA